MKLLQWLVITSALCALSLSCSDERQSYKILGNIEDPQNEIARTIASVLNRHLADSVHVVAGIGSLANLDSLKMGRADFGIVDNYSAFTDKVTSILPLYPQVLHILHRRNLHPGSLRDLFMSGKIFAGIDGSGTRTFVEQLIADLGVNASRIEFVDILHFFDADVIFSFTDLLTQDELKDLKEYKLFSIDDVSALGKGSLVDGICTRHPQFEPFVIARDLYGNFTEMPVLTLKVDAILVCRSDLNAVLVYSVMEKLMENRQEMKNINPLLFDVSMDFDPRRLNFTIHPGSRKFLQRHEPTFLEKYADVLSVIISIVVMAASGAFTLWQWQKARKKNKIDRYYKQLVEIRNHVSTTASPGDCNALLEKLKALQEETIQLVIKEKLIADESFSIFLNLSKIVTAEVQANHRFSKEESGLESMINTDIAK